jgi:hypothetical protein
MENETGPSKSLWRWAITPPQSYAVYLVCLIVIFVGSFYAGTLKPRRRPRWSRPRRPRRPCRATEDD